jgi:hypothetical protein
MMALAIRFLMVVIVYIIILPSGAKTIIVCPPTKRTVIPERRLLCPGTETTIRTKARNVIVSEVFVVRVIMRIMIPHVVVNVHSVT